MFHIGEVVGSNSSLEIDYSDILIDFPQSLYQNAGVAYSLPSIFLPIHYSLILLSGI
jgi:hypothetical protein